LNAWTEEVRLNALQQLDVLDTPPEAVFDDLVKAAARVCQAPMAAISLIDASRQWFKAKVGLPIDQTPRELSFCDHAMREQTLLLVNDAKTDPRFAANPLVTGDPQIGFYAGAPLLSADGAPLGALCVLDHDGRPAGLTPDQASMLRLLADQVQAQLELRRLLAKERRTSADHAIAAAQGAQREAQLVSALGSAALGWWDWDVVTDTLVGNAELARLYGIEKDLVTEGAPLSSLMTNLHPLDRGWVREAMAEAVRTGEPFQEEYRVEALGAPTAWVGARGRCLRDVQGKPSRFLGVAIAVTDRKAAEAQLREAMLGRELALSAASLGRWDHNPALGAGFFDPRALQILGLAADGPQDFEAVIAKVHPGDRAKVTDAVMAAIDPDRSGPYRQTFRILTAVEGEPRWVCAVGRTSFIDGQCVRFLGVLEDVTEEKTAEAHRQLLTAELNHRVKNTLALVVSIVDSSLRQSRDVTAARMDIATRIKALGHAHDILTEKNWSAASVPEIVASMLTSLSLPAARIICEGALVPLGPKPAIQLSLALHELATNAMKYGALSNDVGRIALQWGVEEGVFTFAWIEAGGPTVVKPTRTGFGSRLIERATAAEFAGFVSLDYLQEGVRWSLRAPYAGLAELGRMSAVSPL
jgi:PAS domain S-box-containing protein